MIKVYHNPRCSKSRDGICFLEDIKTEYEVIKYIEEGITIEQLKELLLKLNIKPIDLVRTKEKLWIENFKNLQLSDNEIIKILSENTKLIERPIVVNGNKAVIARPTDKINEIL